MSFIKDNLNKIILGDSYELIKEIPDKSIDLIITDPPYGIRMDKGVNRGGGLSPHTRKQYKGGWDSETPPAWFFQEMVRVSKNLIIFGGNYFADKLEQSNHWLVWDKVGSMDNGDFSDCELIYTNIPRNIVKKYYVLQKGFFNCGDDRIHPTQKPEKLIRMLLKDYAQEGFLIADFFSGSGTTAVVCKQEGFDFIAIEKDEEFYKKSVDRLNGIDSKGQISLFADFANI